jgi:hypothetical protein
MITGTDGFRAYVVNPDTPSIEIHKDCLTQGFGNDSFSTSNIANCMLYYDQKIIIGSSPGLFVDDPTLCIYNVTYPDGIPDRNNPDRQINIVKSEDLKCLRYKTVNHLNITSSGLIAIATSQGAAVFHISWIPELNKMSDSKAWELIKIPDDTYLPCWDDRWTSFIADVSFGDDDTIYVVKNPVGVWKIDFAIDWIGYTHNSKPSAFYPGAECGINYSQLLSGWANPDIVTLHHPYGLIADNDMVYVHGWSGKVNLLTFKDDNDSPSAPTINGPTSGDKGTEYNYTFSSTDPEGGSLYYYIDWGDGSIENWIGPYTSGQNIIVGHTWTKQGSYTVKAKVKDTNNGASYWGYLKVKMPRFKIPLQTFLQKLLERFPNMFILFRSLIKI